MSWAPSTTAEPWKINPLWPAAFLGILVGVNVVRYWRSKDLRQIPARFLRDPFVWVSLLFVIYLGVQAWNSGRFLTYDLGTRKFGHGPPPYAFLPSAYTRAEGWIMLQWFCPALLLAAVIRHQGRRVCFAILYAAIANSAVLALIGILQLVTEAHSMFGLIPVDRMFFSSFGYLNHAGSFFVLTTCLSAGLFFRRILRLDVPRLRLADGLLLLCFVLNLMAAILAKSGAAYLFAAVIIIFTLIFTMASLLPRLSAPSRINLLAAGMAVLCLVGAVLVNIQKQGLLEEYAALVSSDHASPGVYMRRQLHRTAVAVCLDHPVFGTGGWGFRYLLKDHVPLFDLVPGTERQMVKYTGLAHVHNDYLQFLSEFGIIGAGLLLAAMTILALPAFSRYAPRSPIRIFFCLGLVFIALQALFDLPFRSPGVLCYSSMALAAMPKCWGRWNEWI